MAEEESKRAFQPLQDTYVGADQFSVKKGSIVPNDDETTKFKLAFIRVFGSTYRSGHTSIGLLKKIKDDKGNDKTILVTRTGLFRNCQIKQEENFIKPRLGREFALKEISFNDPNQLSKFFDIINRDRAVDINMKRWWYPGIFREELTDEGIRYIVGNTEQAEDTQGAKQEKPPEYMQSTPEGVYYNRYLRNCKDYCLDVLEELGIDQQQINDLKTVKEGKDWRSLTAKLVSQPLHTEGLTKKYFKTQDDGTIELKSRLDKETSIELLEGYKARLQSDVKKLEKSTQANDIVTTVKRFFNLSPSQESIQNTIDAKKAEIAAVDKLKEGINSHQSIEEIKEGMDANKREILDKKPLSEFIDELKSENLLEAEEKARPGPR